MKMAVDKKEEDQKKFSPKRIADILAKSFLIINYGGRFFQKVDGVFRPAEHLIRENLKLILDDYFSIHFVREVFYALESEVFLEELPFNPCFVNFKNGVLNWQTKEFYHHEAPEVKDLIFFHQLSIDYNPKAEGEIIHKFLSEVVRKEDLPALLEFLGYCLIPSTKFEKALVLIGEGANGKSTLLEAFGGLIGSQNFSTLSLHDLADKFRVAELAGKIVNIFPDLPSKALSDTSIFKAAVSGERITAERKYGQPFSFRPYARLIFSANKLPLTPDISPAFFRRFLIIEFPNKFEGQGRDIALKAKLKNKQELEALALLCLEGLQRLYANEKFSESATMRRLVQDYERQSNSVMAFVDERCHLDDPKVEILKRQLYEEYSKFCLKEKLLSLSYQQFNRELKRIIPSLQESRDEARKWRGIRCMMYV